MNRTFKVFAAAVHGLSRALSLVALAGMLFVMLIVVYNVVLRELDRPGVLGVVEYSELGMALTAFFALGEAERRRAHVSVESLVNRLKGRRAIVARLASGGAAAFIAILLAWASYDALSDSLARGEFKLGLVRLPMWPARLAVFAGFLALALEQVVTAVEDVLVPPPVNDVPVEAQVV